MYWLLRCCQNRSIGLKSGLSGGQIKGLDVMPVQTLGFVPTGVIENQHGLASLLFRNLTRHHIQPHLEDFGVTMGDDQADQLSCGWIDRANHILPDVSSIVSLSGTGSTLHPLGARPGISFESRLIAKKHVVSRTFQQGDEPFRKGLTLLLRILTALCSGMLRGMRLA
jgi:hypothetical protein